MSRDISISNRINHINQKNHGSSTSPKIKGGVGGKKNCENFIQKSGQPPIKRKTPSSGEDSVDQAREAEEINRLNCPATLDPKTCTFKDIELHAKLRQRLAPSTIEKNMRYARFMENHIMSVNFRTPSPENFIKHMDYREEFEEAGPSALRHEWKTMKMFLRAWGIEKQWPNYKAPPLPQNEDIDVPPPETVHKFFKYKYSDDPYENKLYQYLFYIGFLIGMRPPSELANLNIENIQVYENGYGSITLIEDKKHKKRRKIYPERFIISSPTRKSLQNWITKWRPMVENGNSDNALFLTPQGKRFSVRYLGKKLRQHGQKIWPGFHPYTMRHWSATARMIEWNFNVDRVKHWMGHSKTDTTINYVHVAYDRIEQDQDKSSWLSRAIISRPKKTGDESKAKAKKSKVDKKSDFWLKILREIGMGPAGFEPATNWL